MQHSEASTEEILGIIKRVIERENREVAANEKRRRESTGFSTAMRKSGTADVIDSPIAGTNRDEVLDLGEAELVIDNDHAAECEDAPVDNDKTAAQAESEPEALTSNAARQSVNDSFAALAMLATGDADEAEAPEGSPLEGMVRAMLRPMLAEWLDKNLPPLVEQLVREEIDRIAGKTS